MDSHVAKHIFDQVIGPEGVLAGKVRTQEASSQDEIWSRERTNRRLKGVGKTQRCRNLRSRVESAGFHRDAHPRDAE